MGEVLIAGTASLLICIFLSPKFIAYLRRREFGQQIREEGPQEHHAKAGTPTMGGIIIFTAIAVPYLLLTDFEARSVGVFGVAVAESLMLTPLVPAFRIEASVPCPSSVMFLVIVTVPKPPGSRASISPLSAVFEIAPAKVLQGAVRLHGFRSSPTPETHVRVCA